LGGEGPSGPKTTGEGGKGRGKKNKTRCGRKIHLAEGLSRGGKKRAMMQGDSRKLDLGGKKKKKNICKGGVSISIRRGKTKYRGGKQTGEYSLEPKPERC